MQRKSGKPKAVMAWSGGKDSGFATWNYRSKMGKILNVNHKTINL